MDNLIGHIGVFPTIFQVPHVLRQFRGFPVPLVVRISIVVKFSRFEWGHGHTDILFSFGVSVVADLSFVDHIRSEAPVVQWTIVLISAVTVAQLHFGVENLLVMRYIYIYIYSMKVFTTYHKTKSKILKVKSKK